MNDTELIDCYDNWDLTWEVELYFQNGQLQAKWFVDNDYNIIWEYVEYYENWQLRMQVDSDWNITEYDENWEIIISE